MLGSKISNANLQDKMDTAQYSSYFTKDGVKHAKIGLEIYRKSGKKWELISTEGIVNAPFTSIRIGRGGKII